MKILVVEDEAGIARFIKQGLEEEGYQVEVASDGVLGLNQATANQYDLLLLDWMLPGKSGLEICQQLRAANDQTPILFLTAKDTLQSTIEGLQAGANDYIKKPFHFEELLERIKVQLRSHNGLHEVLRLGEITVDETSHQVWKNGEEVALTQKEFTLLAYLIRNKGKVCQRTQIIEEVWDIHFEYNTGIIDVYINAIRKKLQLNTQKDYIQTVRGVGYIAKE
jgi:DNA-binding response OmpR family regulator